MRAIQTEDARWCACTCALVYARVCVCARARTYLCMQIRSYTCTYVSQPLSRCAFVTCGASLRRIHKRREHILLAYYQPDEFLMKLLQLREQCTRISITFTASVYLTFHGNRLSPRIRDTFSLKRESKRETPSAN